MKLSEAIEILEKHNEWRRYDEHILNYDEPMVNPTKLGIAIDTVVNHYKNKTKTMNAEKFIEENYFGLKIDCPKDIQTIYQALEDYANEQLRIGGVVERSEQLVCVVDYLSNFTKGKKYECKPDGQNYVETYDDFGDWYSVHKKCFSRTEVAN